MEPAFNWKRTFDQLAPQLVLYARQLVVTSADAEDVVQTSILHAMDHLEGLRDASAFGGWITRIALNTSLKALRKRHGLDSVSLDADAGEDGRGEVRHPEYVADWREDPRALAGLCDVLRDIAASHPRFHVTVVDR